MDLRPGQVLSSSSDGGCSSDHLDSCDVAVKEIITRSDYWWVFLNGFHFAIQVPLNFEISYHPWDWYIYLPLVVFNGNIW